MKVTLIVALAALFGGAAQPQPPTVVHAAGPFTAARIAEPLAIDGREWIAVDTHTVSEEESFTLESLSFTATDCGDHGGDFQRCQLLLRRPGGAPVRIDTGYTSFVFVTPDNRYVITEPLNVLEVQSWKTYVLSEALGIPNYTGIEAISRDGRKLFVRRTDCPYDCRGRQEFDYFVVRLPQRSRLK